MDFYPEKQPEKPAVEPMDKTLCAQRIILAIKAGHSKLTGYGFVLQGNKDIATYESTWDEVMAEKNKLSAIPIEDCKDEAEYKSLVASQATYVDVDKWVAAKKAAEGIKDWAKDVVAIKTIEGK